LRGELEVHVHCYRADDIAVMLNVAHEFGFRIAAVHHAAEAYKVAGCCAMRAPACGQPDWWGFKHEAEDAIPENAAFVDAAGSCAIMHRTFRCSAIGSTWRPSCCGGSPGGPRHPARRAIRWITSSAARALGLEDRISTIAPGMNADVVLWSGDPFSVYTKADQVYIDGSRAPTGWTRHAIRAPTRLAVGGECRGERPSSLPGDVAGCVRRHARESANGNPDQVAAPQGS
jgi:hypothetical protein